MWGVILAFEFVAVILECAEGVGMAVGADEVAAAGAGRGRPLGGHPGVIHGTHLTLLVQHVGQVFGNLEASGAASPSGHILVKETFET